MRKLTLAFAAAGLAALTIGTLQAQGGPPGVADASRVAAGTYKVDSNHSMVGWSVSHFGFNDYFGIFGDVAGEFTLDTANPSASKVDVTIPIASVVVPSSGLRDHLLAGPRNGAPNADFFGPTPAAARFVSTSVTPTGGTKANIVGNLTMNGQTKPVTIAVELAGAGNAPMGARAATVGFHGTTTIKRSEWGVAFGTGFGLADEVDLHITVAGEKQ